MAEANRSLFPGIILISLGAIFLLNQLDVFYFRWWHLYPLVLLALAALFFFSVFTKNQKRAVFPGTVLLSLGLFFFLRNYGYFDLDQDFWYVDELWPVVLIAVGLGFVALYLVKPQDWAVLVPGGVMIFVGAFFVLRNLGIVRRADFRDFWPIIFIAVGLCIVIKSLRKKKPPEVAETSGSN